MVGAKQPIHRLLGGRQGFTHPRRNEVFGLVRPNPYIVYGHIAYLTSESYIIGCPYQCPWVLGGHGCDIIGNIIDNVIIFENMSAI